jgi:hypothetical protein
MNRQKKKAIISNKQFFHTGKIWKQKKTGISTSQKGGV